MKKVGCLVVALSIILWGTTNTNHVKAEAIEINTVLSSNEIQEKILEIADQYEINEPLSEEHAEFIKKYANKPQAEAEIRPMAYKQMNVWGSAENAYIRTTLNGSINSDIGIVNNSFGGNVTVNVTKGTPTKIEAKVRHVAFGAVGSGGTIIGLVQNKTLMSTCTKGVKRCNVNQSWRYTASVAFSNTYGEGVVYYAGGNLGVEGK